MNWFIKRASFFKCESFFGWKKQGSFFKKNLIISVSKRVGNAVIRNRLKRVVREIFRNFVKNDCSVLICAKKEKISSVNFENLKKQIVFSINGRF